MRTDAPDNPPDPHRRTPPGGTMLVECKHCGAEYGSDSWDQDICPKCHLVREKLAQLEAHQARLRRASSPTQPAGQDVAAPGPEQSTLRRVAGVVSRAAWPHALDEREHPGGRRGRILLVACVIVGALAETVFGLRGLTLGVAVGIGVPLVVGGASLFLAGKLFLVDIDLKTAILANAVMGVVAGVLILPGWFMHPNALAVAVLLVIVANGAIVMAAFGCGFARAILFLLVWGVVSMLMARGFVSWRVLWSGW